MRHSAVTYSQQIAALLAESENASLPWDVLFCTDMLGLAEFRGLCPEPVRQLPAIIYFHENQLTYPTQQDDERDFHFAYSNMTSALAADRVWFNSAYHRDEFLTALRTLLHRMPNFGHEEAVDDILSKSKIQHPGIDVPQPQRSAADSKARTPGPLRIVWASRWEHDKNPELFFEAISELATLNVAFELSVLGQSFRHSPPCFEEARHQLASHIRHWGYAETRADYLRILSESDVVVSTARHEFFGISIVEAVAAGCRPLVPRALAYPETLGAESGCFHDGTARGIAKALADSAAGLENATGATESSTQNVLKNFAQFTWPSRSSQLDAAIDKLVEDN